MSDQDKVWIWKLWFFLLVCLAAQVFLAAEEYRSRKFSDVLANRQIEELRNVHTTLKALQVESQLHQERERNHWRTHPGDRVIPGPGRGRGIGEPFGQPPLTEPEPTVAEEFERPA